MNERFSRAHKALMGRSTWEQKQRVFYEMRHEGIRRINKPFPTASDAHFPLIDMTIEKWKPFWLAQALAGDRLAAFVSLKPDQASTAESAADYMDFELKNKSNFEDELEHAVDEMLLRSRGILKVTVDPYRDYRFRFESVDPQFIIMDPHAHDFTDADWFVHVKHFTVEQYKSDRRFDQECLDGIKGGQAQDYLASVFEDKELREGITSSEDQDIVIVWEHYERHGRVWTVYTYSPALSDKDLRAPYMLPIKVDVDQCPPFFSFVMELKDKGWYASRGVAERLAPFEQYATKLWNEKADAMTFGNRPLFTSEGNIPNLANLRAAPGEILPGNIKPVMMPQPAMSFDQEINFSRQTAENLLMMPDFGITRNGNGQPRTATENDRISALNMAGVDHKGRIFRRSLSRLYRYIWACILFYRRTDLSYYVSGELKTMPEQALHDSYLITPDGSTDQWDRQQRFQRAAARLQLFKGAPNVDQDALVRDVLASDDARLVQTMFIPQNLKSATEQEDEAHEIVILAQGFPAAVTPGEDHAARIFVLASWLQKQGMMGAPVDPVARQRVQEHLKVHWDYLQTLQPEAARQLQEQLSAQDPMQQIGQAEQPMQIQQV